MKSDLDITVWIEDDSKILKIIKKIQAISSYYFIIKEINFYLASAPLDYIYLINPLELQRDPILEHRLGKKKWGPTPEQAESYLLRMFSSEHKAGAVSLSNRSQKKWKYHLGRALAHPGSKSIELTSYSQLLEVILKDYFNQSTQRYTAATIELNSSLPLHELIVKSDYANELITLFPEKFCFAIDQIDYKPHDRDRSLLFEQIKWEVWAMLTQPWLFFDHAETTFRHLENLKQVLHKSHPECDLILQIESLSIYMQEILSDQ